MWCGQTMPTQHSFFFTNIWDFILRNSIMILILKASYFNSFSIQNNIFIEFQHLPRNTRKNRFAWREREWNVIRLWLLFVQNTIMLWNCKYKLELRAPQTINCVKIFYFIWWTSTQLLELGEMLCFSYFQICESPNCNVL